MIHLPVRPEEVAVLRYSLGLARHSISEAHPEDHAQLDALLARLEAAQAGSIESQNPAWGFRGGIGNDAMFEEAARELMRRFNLAAHEARDVLDAPIGRHMADQCRVGESATALIARLSDAKWTREIHKAIREVRSR